MSTSPISSQWLPATAVQSVSSGGRAVRLCDITIAMMAIFLLAPVLIVVTLAVIVGGGSGPILFRHARIGRDGNVFYCLKFRTMQKDAEARLEHLLASSPAHREEWERDHKLRRDPRITVVGRFLRVTSLDELPQLWNVVIGEMSLVGPRPITEAEIHRYRRYFADYARVRPGITGLWQISGRNDVNYRRRVAMDVTYARSTSLGLYLRILVLTVPAVLLARGSA
ncbi:sugar transferase [Hephaestia mangrovi]|uniref:sugar transferase n=1 Tax=Hephaestia mangrovi TaxID=2873268 RepID=UPI001CA63BC5|nr:sugar transferase [Hephaestia mangrovi]MBY8829730.1 sugar transferase [Hephaestia mangrovi]